MGSKLTIGIAAWLAALVLAPPTPATLAAPRDSTRAVAAPARTLAARLKASGRAEASFERVVPDPFTGKLRISRGKIALEPPDRVALEFPATGERVTVRADGGEWLQPKLKQWIELGGGEAKASLRWWSVLLSGDGGPAVAKELGRDRYVLVARSATAAGADSAWVWLDRFGLPSRLEVAEEPGTVYRLRNWRFTHARGRSAFVIAPPAGYEIIRLRSRGR